MLKENSLENIHVKLHRIIPFSNVEGIGNRCSIFLQGCNINCLYCHNPETIEMNGNDSKVVSIAYLLDEIKKSMPFIRGITISGGEPTLHNKKLIPLFNECHKLGLTCYLDSNGFFDFENIGDLINVTDKFLFDIKGLGTGLEKLCFDYNNKNGSENNDEVSIPKIMYKNLENLSKLLELGKVEEVRLVHIKGFYDAKLTVSKIAELINKYPEVMFKIIRVHGKGARDEKYILKHSPTIKEHNELCEYAKTLCKNKIIVIN
ncbi:MAG: 4Fe-4S cluster-binding domain-containing protein [Erysipelotrichaceae bacterium]|nr:4Fe-4S cluster-binding domain-containing protein [Erysipelotrichaceae bacterium]